jgi:CRISPR/Cas system-associated exonuclease Cas4 (RecB family)
MKHINRTLIGAVQLGLMLLTANTILAQTIVKETTAATTSAGVISEFGPETIIIRSETSPEPIRYVYSKTTTYVDETGAPVSMETVKSGLPVTVYYVKDGERMVASKVIVRKAVVKTVPTIEEKKTTTTTTETSK